MADGVQGSTAAGSMEIGLVKEDTRTWPLVCLSKFASVKSCRFFLPQCVLCFAFMVDVLITRTAVLYTTQKMGL